jgi:ribokinase
MIHVDSAGRNAITIVAGANAAADPAFVPYERFGAGTTLVLQLEVPMEAVVSIAARAKHRGARVLLNAAPAQPLSADLLATLDVLVVNELEAASIASMHSMPDEPEDFAAAFHRRYACAVVVTLGGAGAVAAVDRELLTINAPQVAVVDTTGAGDALVGALGAALDRDSDWIQALAGRHRRRIARMHRRRAQAALPDRAAIVRARGLRCVPGVRRRSLQ